MLFGLLAHSLSPDNSSILAYGAGGNRTHVRRSVQKDLYVRSLRAVLSATRSAQALPGAQNMMSPCPARDLVTRTRAPAPNTSGTLAGDGMPEPSSASVTPRERAVARQPCGRRAEQRCRCLFLGPYRFYRRVWLPDTRSLLRNPRRNRSAPTFYFFCPLISFSNFRCRSSSWRSALRS